MEFTTICKYQNCGEVFRSNVIVKGIFDSIPSTLAKVIQKETQLHACSYQVWGVAPIIRFEGLIVNNNEN